VASQPSSQPSIPTSPPAANAAALPLAADEITALRARIAELETMAINYQPEPPLLINLSLQILLMSIAFV